MAVLYWSGAPERFRMRVLAIGDVHGCLRPLDALLDWVNPTPDDLVVTLGDYVDRGPDTRGVLDRLVELRRRLNLVCLRGNHELMMLNARDGDREDRKTWLAVGGVQALASYGPPGRPGTFRSVPAAHWEFLEHGLVDYHETDQFIFAHATVLPDVPLDEQPDCALFWEYLPEWMCHYTGKTVVCGHTSQRSGEPKVVPGAVCVDTHAYAGGWLTCLDATTGRYWQADNAGRRRDGWVEYEG
jgi:serine/threonine protein phosphatase 1